MKTSVNEWENISHHLKTAQSYPGQNRAQTRPFKWTNKWKRKKSFFPIYDLPSVPHGIVLHTQEPNWVRTSWTMNLSLRENDIPAWPSDSHRHLLVSSHSVTFISLNYTWPCTIGYKVFPFYRWKNWGLSKRHGWLLAGDGSTRRTHNLCGQLQEFLSFFLFFILMIKVMFIWKNSNISEIKQGRMPKTLQV